MNYLFELQIGADVTNYIFHICTAYFFHGLILMVLRYPCWKPHLRADISRVNRNQSELFELQIGADVTHYRTKESERTPANFQQGKL